MEHADADQKIHQLECELERVNEKKEGSHASMDRVQYEQLSNQLEMQIAQQEQKKTLDELVAHIKGNGKPGLLWRTAMLEKSEQNRVWFYRTIMTGIVTLLGLLLIQLVIHGGLK